MPVDSVSTPKAIQGACSADLSAAHLLLAADCRLRRAGGRLVVVCGTAEIGSHPALVGLDRQLELVDSPLEQPMHARSWAGAP